MAPAAKRRRKNVIESGDDEADLPQDNLLTRFLNSSPTKPGDSTAPSRAPTASPSPVKKRARPLSVRTSCDTRQRCHVKTNFVSGLEQERHKPKSVGES